MEEEQEEEQAGSESTAPPLDAGDPPVDAAADAAAASQAEQLTLYDLLPFAPEVDPPPPRRRWPLPVIGAAVIAVIALAGASSLGSGRSPSGSAGSTGRQSPPTSVGSSPTSSVTPTTSPAAGPTTSVPGGQTATTIPTIAAAEAWSDLGVRPSDLGSSWTDLGLEQSAHVTPPPPTCARYNSVFSKADLHQYAYKARAGDDNGVLSSMVVDTGSATTLASVTGAVQNASFATCAGAIAEQELNTEVVSQPVVDAFHAQRLGLVTASGVTGWRALVNFTGTSGGGSYGLDVFYASSGTRLAMITLSRCFCLTSPVAATAPLLSDEVLAVTAVAHRIAETATAVAPLVDPSSEGGNSTGPCLLLNTAQLDAVLGSASPGIASTIADGANQCDWQEASSGVVIQTGDTVAQYEARLRTVSQPLSGIGDQADVDPNIAGKILARKGQIWIQVVVAGTTADRLNATSLAQLVLAAL